MDEARLHHLVDPRSLAGRLIAAEPDLWRRYTEHAFVRGLQLGTLPEAAFRAYLVQDYKFLIHFARAWALAAAKAEDPREIRACAATVHALVDEELKLHIAYCRSFGLDEKDLLSAPEHPATTAYTSFVLERGLTGDLLDLLVALAPCVIGYGEIGARLGRDPETRREGNPYRAWIETYAGDAYAEVARAASAQLERVAAARIGPAPEASPRWPGLAAVFARATALEVGFWQMGLDAAR
ncbi:MAG: TenA family protein [Geminicoccaceae bacterium]|nr:TenA family protein [Geminicoccaceae bacterium]MCS7269108.1 TenA family protein [Geminicoccaceae bacterium]MDW8125787.1 TenA family protein [Geminicoccaceae bacterium]MDW8340539.1 TenA family protein [Geminicoccaceae bacterium]